MDPTEIPGQLDRGSERGGLWLVEPRSREERPCSAEQVAQLRARATTPESWDFHLAMAVGGLWLRCACGLLRHVSRSYRPHLQRNPDQAMPSMRCWFCRELDQPNIEPEVRDLAHPPARPDVGLQLLLRLPVYSDDAASLFSSISGGGPGRGAGAPRWSPRGMLRWLIQQAGWNNADDFCAPETLWRRLARAMVGEEVEVGRSRSLPLSRLLWLPALAEAGGLTSFVWDLLDTWTDGLVTPEVWVLAFLEDDDAVRREKRTALRLRDATGTSRVIEIAPQQVFRPRASGPYLALLLGTLQGRDPRPTWQRVYLEAVAERRAPIPVDSSYEREAIVHLLRRPQRIVRPLFPDAEGFVLDLLLPDLRTFVEIQGMRLPAYREHKALVHARLQQSALWQQWRGVYWNPSDGEPLMALLQRVPWPS